MMRRILNCLRNVGVTEFVIIRGYLGKVYEERIKELGEVMIICYYHSNSLNH